MAYVMIIDDDEDFAQAAGKALSCSGHEVQIELDPRSAAASMAVRGPDLVILDVMFPEDSSGGFEFARNMKHGDGKLKDVPVLMLTAVNEKFPLGFSSRDIDDQLMPVSDFLEKPVDLDVLCEKVSTLLAQGGCGE